jgi:hypothetical protein
MALTGCGAVQHNITLQDKYLPQAQTKIEVGQVTNETKETFDVNVEQMLTNALAEQLRKEAMLWDGISNPKLVLNSKIVEYDKGNAFKRWLLPGWGTTVLTIQCDLKGGDKIVGSVEARRTISIGGGYTIGAWETIFASVAHDVVEDLRSKIPK